MAWWACTRRPSSQARVTSVESGGTCNILKIVARGLYRIFSLLIADYMKVNRTESIWWVYVTCHERMVACPKRGLS